MAEAVLSARFDEAGLDDEVMVDSAGTSGWHIGDDADARARATLADAGYTLDHSGRRFEPEWFETSDLVLAMDADNYAELVESAERYGAAWDHVRLLRSFDPTAPPEAEVPDPYYGGRDGFREVLSMIERAADGVVDFVRAEAGA